MARVSAVAGIVVTGLLLSACEGGRSDSVEQTDTTELARQCNTSLSGELEARHIERIRRQAQRLDGAGQWIKHSSMPVAIQPLCESHQKNEQALRNGEFVARLIIMDTLTPYSDLRTDIVFMWVYRTSDGVDRAQFVSLSNPDAANAIISHSLEFCQNGEYLTEEAGWHGDTCEVDTAATRSMRFGDNPWFGCTRGCCYSTKIQRLSDPQPVDTTRADTVGADTTRRDTTP